MKPVSIPIIEEPYLSSITVRFSTSIRTKYLLLWTGKEASTSASLTEKKKRMVCASQTGFGELTHKIIVKWNGSACLKGPAPILAISVKLALNLFIYDKKWGSISYEFLVSSEAFTEGEKAELEVDSARKQKDF